MKFYSTLTLEDCTSIARDLGLVLYSTADFGIRVRGKYAGKRALAFLLRPSRDMDDDYRSYGQGGRRIHAVNWYGHRDFMRQLFDRDPDATLDSALARYHGREQFDALHGLTGEDLNRGYQPKVTA